MAGVVVMVFLAGGWLFGDDTKKDPPPKARATLPTNWNKLGLSDAQKQKILSTRSEYRTKIEALQREIKELQKKELEECSKVLTDAQKARLREILTEKVPANAVPKDGAKPAADKKPDADKKP
jgi:hypothetical protein